MKKISKIVMLAMAGCLSLSKESTENADSNTSSSSNSIKNSDSKSSNKDSKSADSKATTADMVTGIEINKADISIYINRKFIKIIKNIKEYIFLLSNDKTCFSIIL